MAESVGFAALYVGGNELCNANVERQEICDNIRARILKLSHAWRPQLKVVFYLDFRS